jgi:hypothetical protein
MEVFLAIVKQDLLNDDLSQSELSQIDRYVHKVPQTLLEHCDHSPSIQCNDCPKMYAFNPVKKSKELISIVKHEEELENLPQNEELKNLEQDPIEPDQPSVNNDINSVQVVEAAATGEPIPQKLLPDPPVMPSPNLTQLSALIRPFKNKKYRKTKSSLSTTVVVTSSSDESTKPRKICKKKKKLRDLSPIQELIRNLKFWGDRIDRLMIVTQETPSLLRFAQFTERSDHDLFQEDISLVQEDRVIPGIIHEEKDEILTDPIVEDRADPVGDLPTFENQMKESNIPFQDVVNSVDPTISVPQQTELTKHDDQECDICLLALHDDTPLYPLENCTHVFHLSCVYKCISSRGIQKQCVKCFCGIPPHEEKNITNLYRYGVRKQRMDKRVKKSL